MKTQTKSILSIYLIQSSLIILTLVIGRGSSFAAHDTLIDAKNRLLHGTLSDRCADKWQALQKAYDNILATDAYQQIQMQPACVRSVKMADLLNACDTENSNSDGGAACSQIRSLYLLEQAECNESPKQCLILDTNEHRHLIAAQDTYVEAGCTTTPPKRWMSTQLLFVANQTADGCASFEATLLENHKATQAAQACQLWRQSPVCREAEGLMQDVRAQGCSFGSPAGCERLLTRYYFAWEQCTYASQKACSYHALPEFAKVQAARWPLLLMDCNIRL